MDLLTRHLFEFRGRLMLSAAISAGLGCPCASALGSLLRLGCHACLFVFVRAMGKAWEHWRPTVCQGVSDRSGFPRQQPARPYPFRVDRDRCRACAPGGMVSYCTWARHAAQKRREKMGSSVA